MARSAALPVRRPTGTLERPRVALRVVHPRGRRRHRGTPPLFVAIEWFLLTIVGAGVLSLATG